MGGHTKGTKLGRPRFEERILDQRQMVPLSCCCMMKHAMTPRSSRCLGEFADPLNSLNAISLKLQ